LRKVKRKYYLKKMAVFWVVAIRASPDDGGSKDL
jgi:hypothetical protein